MLVVFDSDKFDSFEESMKKVSEGKDRIVSGNPEVFQALKDMYESGEIRELVMVAGGRSYVADPDGVMREYPDLEKLMTQVGWKPATPQVA